MRTARWLALGLIVFNLQGCAAYLFAKDKIENFWLARWDSHEAALVADVHVQAHAILPLCDPKTHTAEQRIAAVGELRKSSQHLLAYSQTLPDDNSAVITVAKNINDASNEFYQRAQSNMGRVYCENKATNLQYMATQGQRVVQAKRK